MAGKTHIVKQGESVAGIAKKYGFSNWLTIYNHADNAELKQKRPNPNVLYPGDKVVIPEKTVKEESGATEQRHRFRFKGDITLSLAAYNAGSTKVRQYRGIPPFRVTKRYIQKVLEYYEVYRQEISKPMNSLAYTPHTRRKPSL